MQGRRLQNSLCIFLLAILCCCIISCSTSNQQSKSVSSNTTPTTLGKNIDVNRVEDVILEMVNKHRKSKQLPLLKLHASITAQALEHSKKMASMSIPFGHDGFNNRFNALKNLLPNVQKGAENVAAGNASMQVIMTDWLNSKGHKKILKAILI